VPPRSVSDSELTTILTTTATTVAASTTSPTAQFLAYRAWSRPLPAPGSVGVRGSSPLSSTLLTRQFARIAARNECSTVTLTTVLTTNVVRTLAPHSNSPGFDDTAPPSKRRRSSTDCLRRMVHGRELQPVPRRVLSRILRFLPVRIGRVRLPEAAQYSIEDVTSRSSEAW
jgi:hypothetical protein